MHDKRGQEADGGRRALYTTGKMQQGGDEQAKKGAYRRKQMLPPQGQAKTPKTHFKYSDMMRWDSMRSAGKVVTVEPSADWLMPAVWGAAS